MGVGLQVALLGAGALHPAEARTYTIMMVSAGLFANIGCRGYVWPCPDIDRKNAIQLSLPLRCA
ncbi:hypothetical protein FIBSPDRAFT_851839 [Athelia psychrophila]|uniref:Uncharacterized protein n=1 Tax=Athelia psychrophila TaxID=1759441 RepID=A0A166S4T9_9AGAM|nr:hypothetical protein FIBSPDRAFT_851839 [Fibularhizoctonia sp. CBS 109695]